jgi:hypothetical protein
MSKASCQQDWRTRLRRDRYLQAELLGLWTVGVALTLLAVLLIARRG